MLVSQQPPAPVFEQPTQTCRDLNEDLAGREVALAGFASTIRDHGDVVFVDLRDAHGEIQVLLSPEFGREAFEAAKTLRPESTLSVRGRVRLRPEGTENPNAPLGDIEITAHAATVLSRAAPLPFPLDDAQNVHESVLLKYRYLHLRTDRLQRNLRLRFELLRELRTHFHRDEFVEVETPVLFKSTPEGSRDFLVPSRLHAGGFYALTQSPQMLKQLLMVGGLPRYLQVTRCFRDEDNRADRQPEFTQLDLEAAFLTQDAFMELAERNVLATLHGLAGKADALGIRILGSVPSRIQRIPHAQAMDLFGSDKPDLRFGVPLLEARDILKATTFTTFGSIIQAGGSIRYLCLARRQLGEDLPRSFLDGLPAFAKAYGSQGLAWVRVQADGSWQGPAGKFFSDAEKRELLARASVPNCYVPETLSPLDVGEGTMLFFCASTDPFVVWRTLGALRLKLAEVCRFPLRPLTLAWIVDWPLFEYDPKTKTVGAAHHPFTAPSDASLEAFLGATREGLRPGAQGLLSTLRAQAFDLVCNGAEVGGGSARIFSPAVQSQMFALLGLPSEKVQERFGFFIEALQYGTPPHVGMALGIDRLCALLAGENSIRDVIAFPKTGSGACLMSGCPTHVEPAQLRDVHIAVRGE